MPTPEYGPDQPKGYTSFFLATLLTASSGALYLKADQLKTELTDFSIQQVQPQIDSGHRTQSYYADAIRSALSDCVKPRYSQLIYRLFAASCFSRLGKGCCGQPLSARPAGGHAI